jgi:hypothetical protein
MVRVFMENFEPWTVSFFKRFFQQLNQLPEMKSNAKHHG